jgi:pyridinium-3,5-bisthiocarboxylic acid mononucleotide nickel chelatase
MTFFDPVMRLERKSVSVNTRWGTVRLKESRLNGAVTNYSPEYDDCRRIAEQQSVPLKQVQQEAVTDYLVQRAAHLKSQLT